MIAFGDEIDQGSEGGFLVATHADGGTDGGAPELAQGVGGGGEIRKQRLDFVVGQAAEVRVEELRLP